MMIQAIINGNVIATSDSRDEIRNDELFSIIGGYTIVRRKTKFSIHDYLWMVEQYRDGEQLLEIRYYDYSRRIIWNGANGRPVPNQYQSSAMRSC